MSNWEKTPENPGFFHPGRLAVGLGFLEAGLGAKDELVAHPGLQNLLLCSSRVGQNPCRISRMQFLSNQGLKIREKEENQGLCCQKNGLFHGRKEAWLSFCPKIEGEEPLSKLPVLLEEAGRQIQTGAGFRDGIMDGKTLPSCSGGSEGLHEGWEWQERIS